MSDAADPRVDQLVTSAEGSTNLEEKARTKPLLELFDQIIALAIRLRQSADLPGAEFAVLEIINRCGPRTVPQIARARATSRQNIQIIVDRLAAMGRVRLNGNPAHKKSLLVVLTDTGRSSLAVGESAQKNLMLDLKAGLSEAEVMGTLSVLSKIRGILAVENKRTGTRKQGQPANPGATQPDRIKSEGSKGEEPPTEEFPVNLL